jgi:hypothetical protein
MRFPNEISVDAQADELFAFRLQPRAGGPVPARGELEGRDGDDRRGAMSMKVGPIKASYTAARCASSRWIPRRAAR